VVLTGFSYMNHALRPRLRDVRYDWGRPAGSRLNGLSDHAALLLDLRA